MELYSDNILDIAPLFPLHTSDRLDLLFRRRKAWQTLDWKHSQLPSFSGVCTAYELVSGVFMQNLRQKLSILTFPSKPEVMDLQEQQKRRDLDWHARDFAIDPTQDLAIFLRIFDGSVPLSPLKRAEMTNHFPKWDSTDRPPHIHTV